MGARDILLGFGLGICTFAFLHELDILSIPGSRRIIKEDQIIACNPVPVLLKPHNASDTIVATSSDTTTEEFSPFLANRDHAQLRNLVRLWRMSAGARGKTFSIKAADLLWEIVNSTNYIQHKPNSGIVFLKTYKTGSSTITSILHSLATSHHLITPVNTKSIFTPWTNRILKLNTTQKGTVGAPYDIWTNHIQYDKRLFTQVVPTAKAGKHFAILRDPAKRIRSGSAFLKKCNAMHTLVNATHWNDLVLQSTTTESMEEVKEDGPEQQHFVWFCRQDYTTTQIVGEEVSDTAAFQKELKAAYQRVKSGKLLLLVTERMMESLLTLWKFYELHPLDITFFSMKVKDDGESNSVKEESARTIQALERMRGWHPEDVKMHQFANEMLSKKLRTIFAAADMTTTTTTTTKASIRRTSLLADTAVLPVVQQAVSELETLNKIIFHICRNVLGSVDTDNEKWKRRQHVASRYKNGLGYWCMDKVLDNKPWNEYHLNRLGQSNQSIPSYDKAS